MNNKNSSGIYILCSAVESTTARGEGPVARWILSAVGFYEDVIIECYVYPHKNAAPTFRGKW